MVTGGGTINASNLTVETQGGSSAAIRSDRGGGTIIVNGGSYTSNGSGSPAIYSTADITVNNAKLVSNVASGVVIEGDNSVALNSVDLYNSNTKSNTKGEEANYKNIFIYQSTSGDAKEGTGTFTAKDSKITTTNGSTIFVTNTKAVITLENNEIINTDENGLFLKASAARWGKEGSNGGTVTLNMINQYVDGNIVLDSISTLDLSMTKGSVLVGAINTDNTAKNISLKLSSDSVLSLTADTYISSLDNELSDNSNIYSNGKYKLYVDGKEVSINSGTYNGEKPIVEVDLTANENNPTKNNNAKESNNVIYYIVGGCAVIIALTSGIILIIKKRKNR